MGLCVEGVVRLNGWVAAAWSLILARGVYDNAKGSGTELLPLATCGCWGQWTSLPTLEG